MTVWGLLAVALGAAVLPLVVFWLVMTAAFDFDAAVWLIHLKTVSARSATAVTAMLKVKGRGLALRFLRSRSLRWLGVVLGIFMMPRTMRRVMRWLGRLMLVPLRIRRAAAAWYRSRNSVEKGIIWAYLITVLVILASRSSLLWLALPTPIHATVERMVWDTIPNTLGRIARWESRLEGALIRTAYRTRVRDLKRLRRRRRSSQLSDTGPRSQDSDGHSPPPRSPTG